MRDVDLGPTPLPPPAACKAVVFGKPATDLLDGHVAAGRERNTEGRTETATGHFRFFGARGYPAAGGPMTKVKQVAASGHLWR